MLCPATSLWMGDIAPEMDENFIVHAFAQLGETVERVKIMDKGKYQGRNRPGRYCFVEFPDADAAQRVLYRYNGHLIPGTPGIRFKLNTSSRDQKALPDYSLFVGDLLPTITDSDLCGFFQSRYPSVYGAKVILTPTGKSRGFGFVRFSNEKEQLRALTEMQNALGLGGNKPLKVNLASNKQLDSSSNEDSSTNSHHQTYQNAVYQNQLNYEEPTHQFIPPPANQVQHKVQVTDEDAETLEDPGLEINVGKENREFIDSSESFFTALEASRWQPLDTILSEISG